MPKVKYGQTLFISPKSGPISAQLSVRAWYNQIVNYDFQRPRINTLNSYFVQLVWRMTNEVGVGKFTANDGKTYMVAFYRPFGDSDDSIQYNVLPVTGMFSKIKYR